MRLLRDELRKGKAKANNKSLFITRFLTLKTTLSGMRIRQKNREMRRFWYFFNCFGFLHPCLQQGCTVSSTGFLIALHVLIDTWDSEIRKLHTATMIRDQVHYEIETNLFVYGANSY